MLPLSPTPVDEQQTITFGGTITGGTFSLSNVVNYFRFTPFLNWSANPTTLASTIQNALNAMAPVGGLNGVAITGATNASPIVISTGSTAGLVNGDMVTISGVKGNTAANGTWTIAGLTGNSFQLVNSTGNGAYTANTGTWSSGVTVTPVAGSSNSFTVTFNGATCRTSTSSR